jgi:hypothetical protein
MVIGHYTSLSGLVGILESNCLHATSFDASNDHLELTAGRAAVEKICREIAQEFPVGFSPSDKSEFLEADEAFQEMVRQSSAENVAEVVFRSLQTVLNPFICCFSKIEEESEKTDGDLTQWRSYSSDDGALIKFDPEKLNSAIDAEYDNFHFGFLRTGDVSYDFNDAVRTIEPHRDTIKSIFEYHELRNKDSKTEVSDEFLEAFVGASAFTKAPCFASEREHRISLAIPNHSQYQKLPKRKSKKRKNIFCRIKG